MRTVILVFMVVVPSMAFASTDCRLLEYPDHFEAICIGDPPRTSTSAQAAGQQQTPMSGQATGEFARLRRQFDKSKMIP